MLVNLPIEGSKLSIESADDLSIQKALFTEKLPLET